MQTTRYATVCSGIEAMTVALKGLPWAAVFFSEIDPFPNALLAHHYPNITNLGRPAPKTLRYKALGNAWAINCARWVLLRLHHEMHLKYPFMHLFLY